MTTAFLSFKNRYAQEAEALVEALSIVLPRDEIFVSSDIGKGDDWRADIERALGEAKCLIMLYGDPQLDWSWCFYEAGGFARMGATPRPIFCLHPTDVEPPSPLANLQTIKATPDELETWIRNSLCSIVGCRQPVTEVISASIEKIERLVSDMSPIQEKVLKPFIWIDLTWPGPGAPNWNDPNALADHDIAGARVSIDAASALQLGFGSPQDPPNTLLQFLRELDCETEWSDDGVEFWVTRFFDALREATRGRLQFQEAAYFRHESGKILRPVVVSYARNVSGTARRLRVIFASAFGSPLTDNPSLTQRLSVGLRLAVRTRLEVLDPFLGRMSQVYRTKMLSQDRRDSVARRNPIGSRVIEALDAIWQEALAHGMRPGGPPPELFESLAAQREYEEIRDRAQAAWHEIKDKAREEDQNGTGNYPESERLLGELAKTTQAYLDLGLPRLRELLTAGQSATETTR